MSVPQTYSVVQVHRDWWRTIDTALEAGGPALLEWSASRRPLYEPAILFAYQGWSRRRRDVSKPTMVVGHVDTVWLAPLLLAEPVSSGSVSSVSVPSATLAASRAATAVRFVFGGVDVATYQASLTTEAAAHIRAGIFFAVDLPPSMAQATAPMTQPHTHVAWQTLPIALLSPPQPLTAPQTFTGTVSDAGEASVDPWVSWCAFIMIIVLVLLALLL